MNRISIIVITISLLLSGCNGNGDNGGSTPEAQDPSGSYDFVSTDSIPASPEPKGGEPSPLCIRTASAKPGLSLVSTEEISERTTRYTFYSEAMRREESAVVTLPPNYDDSGDKRYPLLYLLHGSAGNEMYWIDNGVEEILADYDVITVTPNGGPQGKYVDYYGVPRLALESYPHAVSWETFHIKELLPYIEQNFPVRTDKAGRATAGVSAGGYGATKYASIYPSLFGAVGSFSGGLNTTYQYPVLPLFYSVGSIPNFAPGSDPDACAWGDPLTHKVLWFGNDPSYLVENIEGTRLYITSGDGTIGELDRPEDYAFGVIELITYLNTLFYVEQLDEYQIEYETNLYGAGTHSVVYWLRELDVFLDAQRSYWSEIIEMPEAFNYRTIYNEFQAWNWHFAITRDVDEFVYLRDVSLSGFEVSGTGVLEVLTPKDYKPNSEYIIEINSVEYSALSSDSGRLMFAFEIAPSNTERQTDFSREAEADFPTASVIITEK